MYGVPAHNSLCARALRKMHFFLTLSVVAVVLLTFNTNPSRFIEDERTYKRTFTHRFGTHHEGTGMNEHRKFHVMHVHVPKTAGTMMVSVFREIYASAPERLCFPKLQPTCCFNLQSTRDELINFTSALALQPDMCDVSSSEWSYDDLSTYGVVDLPEIKLFTMVRNPLMLARSAIEHDITLTKNHEQYNFYKTVQEKLKLVASSGPQRGIPIQNTLSKWLLPRNHTSDPLELEIFLNTKYYFVGVQEFFEHSLCLLKYRLGHDPIQLSRTCDCKTLQVSSSTRTNARSEKELNEIEYKALELKFLSEQVLTDNILYSLSVRRFFFELKDMQEHLNVNMLGCLLNTTQDHDIRSHMCSVGVC